MHLHGHLQSLPLLIHPMCNDVPSFQKNKKSNRGKMGRPILPPEKRKSKSQSMKDYRKNNSENILKYEKLRQEKRKHERSQNKANRLKVNIQQKKRTRKTQENIQVLRVYF